MPSNHQATHIDAADRAARHWRFAEAGPLPAGTDRHREAACRMFRDTFNPYKPAVIDWPQLDAAAVAAISPCGSSSPSASRGIFLMVRSNRR